MKFYTQSHQYCCGIDLHARSLYVCILHHDGTILVHKDIKARALTLLAHKLGRAVYFMLQRKQVFDQQRFLNESWKECRQPLV